MAAPDEAPPYQISDAVNEQDRGLVITIVAAILLVGSCLFVCLRLWLRWPWKALFGLDDVCTCVAQVFAVAQTCVVFAAVDIGLGKEAGLLSKWQMTEIQKLVFGADLLFVVAVWLSRLSVALLFLRLAGERKTSARMKYFAYTVSTLLVGCVLATAIRDDALRPWSDGLAVSMWYRWIGVGVVGCLIELALVVLSIVLIWNLQMSPKQKFTVVSGFVARLSVIAPLVVRAKSLHDHVDSTNFSSSYTVPALWTQVELHLSLIAASLPCLRIFLKSFNTGYYGMDIEQIDPSGTILATNGDSYALSNMNSGGSTFASRSHAAAARSHRKSGITTSKVTTREGDGDGDSAASERSDKGIVVRQTVDVNYGKQES